MSRTIDADALLDDLQELLNQEVIGSTVSDFGNGIALAMQRVMAAQEATLNDLRDAIYEDAVAHGLWEEKDSSLICASMIRREVIELQHAAIGVICVQADGGEDTEVSAHYAEELADVIIMCLSVAGKLGIDIDAAVRRKMEINRSRPWKHGK